MNKENIVDKLKNKISEIINLDKNEISDSSAVGKTPGWDSLKHMEIVLFIEEEYGIEPTAESVLQMMNFKGICDVVIEGKKNKKNSTVFTENDFIKAFQKIGLKKDDHIFVQSAIGSFGVISKPLKTITNAFLSIIGSEGTLAVPAFSNVFFNGNTFNRYDTPSEAGIFSEYVRTLKNSKRSVHPPFHSVAAIGKYAEILAEVETSTSFSRKSAFGKMYDLDFKLCLLGTTLKHTTFFHYVEEQAQVPYRFFKSFTSTVEYSDNRSEIRTYDYFARYSEPLIKADFHMAGEKILKEIDAKIIFLGLAPIYLVSARKLVDVTLSYLAKDITFLIDNSDKWKVKEIIDGKGKK